MKWSFLLFSSLFCLQAFAQYPATGNKARLGWQTTADGLVYRGAIGDTTTLDPSGLNNAWMLLDTASGNLYAYRAKAWRLVSGGGGSVSDTLTGEVKGPLDSTYVDTVYNINFDITADTTAGVGELKYNDTQGSLMQGLKGGNVTNIIGQQLHQRVLNKTGSPLAKGEAVFLQGSQGNRITVAKAIATADSTSANTFGIVAESIANNQSGYVITEGLITNMNTNALTEGAAVYLSPTVAGELTTTKPQAPQHTVYIGVCVKQNAGSGELFVKIRNGQELDELHDVRIDSLASNASLYYNAAQGVWRDTGAAVLVADTSAMLSPYLKESELSFSSTTGVSSFSTVVVNSFNALPWDGARVVGITTITGSTGEITLDLNGNQVILDISANLSLSGTTDTIELQSSTGTSVHFLAGQNVNLTQSNDTMTISVPISVSTNLSFSGTSDTIGLQSGTGQKVFFRKGDNINITQTQDTMALDVPLALSISTSLAAGPSTVIVDGSNKLPWDGTYVVGITAAATAGVTITLNDQSVSFNPLQFIDTSAMLSSYVNFADTAAMLSPYLKKADTLSLSNRINAKLNISDTTAMLSPYLKKADTTSLSNRINTKLNISDTSVFARDFQIGGTTHYLLKHIGTNATGNSKLYEKDTNGYIGWNTTTVNNKFQIGDVGSSGYAGADLAIGNGTQVMALSQEPTHSLFLTNTNFSFMPAGVGATGRVGIGTTSPLELLDVNGVGRFRQSGGSGGGPIEISDRKSTFNQSINWNVYYDGASWKYRNSDFGASIGLNSAGDLLFYNIASGTAANNVSSFRERFRINENGNIGIATASPARSLHITATDAIKIPAGTTVERPSVGITGDLRMNTSPAADSLEYYNGTSWVTVQDKLQNPVTGTGTANRLAKFTGTSSLGNSPIVLTGDTLITFGTSPLAPITINTEAFPNTPGQMPYTKFKLNTGYGTNGISMGDPSGPSFGTQTALQFTTYDGTASGGFDYWSTRLTGDGFGNFHISNSPANSDGDTVMTNRLSIMADGKIGIGNSSPARTLHVTGETRITDLTTDTPTRIVGADADGDLAEIKLGTGLSLSNDTLKTSGVTSVYIPINLFAIGDTVTNTTTAKDFFLVHSGLNGYCIDSYTVKAIAGTGSADIQLDKNGTGGNLQAISGTTTATKDTNIALATGDYIRGQVFNLSGTLVGLGLTLEIKKTCN